MKAASDIAFATTTTATTASIVSGVGVILSPDVLWSVGIVAIVTLAARLLVLLLSSEDKPVNLLSLCNALLRSVMAACLVSIVTLTLGAAAGMPLPIISALGTIFGAKPALLIRVLGLAGTMIEGKFRDR